MAKGLEVEMSDFFGRQYNEAWKFDGDEIARLYCVPLSGETGPSIVFNPEKSLRGSSRGCSTPIKAKASPVRTCTSLWSFR
jgi:hypothetical protein